MAAWVSGHSPVPATMTAAVTMNARRRRGRRGRTSEPSTPAPSVELGRADDRGFGGTALRRQVGIGLAGERARASEHRRDDDDRHDRQIGDDGDGDEGQHRGQHCRPEPRASVRGYGTGANLSGWT